MRRFLTRLNDGSGQSLVIDPGTLSPALYLSGLPNDGLTPAAGNLATWQDKVSGTNFAPSAGSAGITVFNDGSQGEKVGVWSASICGGSFFRGFENAGLGNFSNANGYTQYFLIGGEAGGTYGLSGFFWPTGATGTGFIYQAPGFNGGGGNFWVNGVAVAGNIVVKGGPANNGYDTGIATPTNQNVYDLWTLVSDGSTNTILYRNGVKGPTLATGAVGLTTKLAFGGPSAGAAFICSLMSSYILYTSQHTAGQIAGVHAWFRQHYGAS